MPILMGEFSCRKYSPQDPHCHFCARTTGIKARPRDPTRELTHLRLVVDDEHMVRWLLDRGADPNLGHTYSAMTQFQMPPSMLDRRRENEAELARINQLTNELLTNASEAEKNEIRENRTRGLSPEALQRLWAIGGDPVLVWYRSQAGLRVIQERGPLQQAVQNPALLKRPPYSDSGAALDAAASHSSITMVDLLIEHGANIENSLGLHHAAENTMPGDAGRIAMMEHLLALGLDVNKTDEIRGFRSMGTALHCAVWGQQIERARFLLENGADPNRKNRLGKVPMEMFRPLSNREDFVELFRKYSTTKS
jgi:Ankyrin repeats (3 copies)